MITAEMVQSLISDYENDRPRSKQATVGPSDLSSPCDRRVGYKLLGTPPVVPQQASLAAFVGSSLHSRLEQVLKDHPDWTTEQQLTMKVAKGLTLTGTLDAYHRPSKTIVDWKSAGPSALAKYRTASPENYRTQVAIYGLMAILSGRMSVMHTAIAYIPRNGSLNDIHVDCHPWDEERADAAMRRYEALHAASQAGEAVLPLLPTAHDCRFCRWWNPNAWADGVGCPGHQDPPQAVGGNPTQQEKETTP